MFLSFLAASLVALALVAQATGFTPTLAAIATLNCVRGMNRIRHGIFGATYLPADGPVDAPDAGR